MWMNRSFQMRCKFSNMSGEVFINRLTNRRVVELFCVGGAVELELTDKRLCDLGQPRCPREFKQFISRIRAGGKVL